MIDALSKLGASYRNTVAPSRPPFSSSHSPSLLVVMISELHRVNSSVVWWRYGHFLFDLVSTVIARRGSEVTDVKASDQSTET